MAGNEELNTQPRSWRAALRGNVLMMGVVSLFTDASSEMIYPLLPVFISGLVPAGSAEFYLGMMAGVAETTASLLKIFSGRLSDITGRRKLLVVIGYGLSSVFRPLIGLAQAGWQVIFLRFCDRVGKGIRTSPRDALISYSVGPEVRGLAFGFHRAMDHFGAVMGPVIAAVILYVILGRGIWLSAEAGATDREMYAMRWLFGLALIPGLAAMFVAVVKVREVVPPAGSPADDRPVDRFDAWRMLPARFYYFVGAVTLFALGNSSDLFLLLLARTKFSLGMLSLLGLWVGLHVSKVVFSFVGGALSDKVGRRPLIVAGWIVYALVYVGMALVTQQWQFWSLFIIYGLYYGMTEGAERALIADFVSQERRGTAYGIYHGVVGLAAFPASVVFGLIWKLRGSVAAFSLGALLAGGAAVLLIVLLAVGGRDTKPE